MENKILLHKLDNLIEGTVTKRPSKLIKSPYVADIIKQDNETILGHCASLGCCGLADNGATILMAESPKKTKEGEKLKCTYTVYLSIFKEKGQNNIIGIHPKLGEKLVGVNAGLELSLYRFPLASVPEVYPHLLIYGTILDKLALAGV